MSYDNQYSGDITKSQTADSQRVNGKEQDHQRQDPVFKQQLWKEEGPHGYAWTCLRSKYGSKALDTEDTGQKR